MEPQTKEIVITVTLDFNVTTDIWYISDGIDATGFNRPADALRAFNGIVDYQTLISTVVD